MSAESWLDIMPAIPLANATPARLPRGDRVVVYGSPVMGGGVHGEPCRMKAQIAPLGRYVNVDDLRVDLDDPQGFAYALRWAQEGGYGTPAWDGILTGRWLDGATTDADRVALARALAGAS